MSVPSLSSALPPLSTQGESSGRLWKTEPTLSPFPADMLAPAEPQGAGEQHKAHCQDVEGEARPTRPQSMVALI